MLWSGANPENFGGDGCSVNVELYVECQLNAKMLNPKKSVNKPFLENISV